MKEVYFFLISQIGHPDINLAAGDPVDRVFSRFIDVFRFEP